MLEKHPRGRRLRAWLGLRRRDYLILPAIFALTPLLLLGLAEAVLYYPFYEQPRDACMVTDPVLGHKPKPNCRSRYKIVDSAWIENRYNDCGYRTAESCGPKPAGAIRAAVIGSSISAGYMVPYRQMFTTRAAADLTRDCRRPVEFQDLGGIGYQWERLYARMQEALALKPDLLVLAVTPFDMEEGVAKPPDLAARPEGLVARVRSALQSQFKGSTLWEALIYFKLLDPQFYLRTFLNDARASGYMRTPLSPFWQSRISALDKLLGQISAASHAAGVPFVLLYVPPRPQILLLNRAANYPDMKPMELESMIGAEAAQAGINYIDLTGTFQAVSNTNSVFFTLSDHPTGLGHKLIADKLVARLLSAGIPPLAGCSMAGAEARSG
ncbi:SGNH/GDSL hydrolase family protein [Rhodopila sp.]|uniref:SGNH/GDSL hydrolase family protein n=1 Tax=Rhodopila sp. TaxID=2480087 RepID=UPI003D147D04